MEAPPPLLPCMHRGHTHTFLPRWKEMAMAVPSRFILASIVLMIAMAAKPSRAKGDPDFIPDQPRVIYIRNQLVGRLPMAVMCYLNKRQIWKSPRYLMPGQELALRPDDWNVYDYVRYECGVWAPIVKQWCTFRAYDTLLHIEDCMGYGCRWIFRRDAVYFGVMQNKHKQYTGGPYHYAGRWCT